MKADSLKHVGKHHTVRLILGDQLNSMHSWFSSVDDDVLYVLMEMRQETDYAVHHIQKVVGFFQAMRAFAEYLDDRDFNVLYLKLDAERNTQKLPDNLKWILEETAATSFEYQLPDEYRLDEQLKEFCSDLAIESAVVDTEHFLTTREEVGQFFDGKKDWVMEYFYRDMRKRHDWLMDGKKPAGGQWNYDKENRKKLPKDHKPVRHRLFRKDVQDLVKMIEQAGVKTMGSIDAEHFVWPADRQDALHVLNHFIEQLLPNFGRYEDAMSTDDQAVYHSRLSFALNVKMIHPKEVIEKAIEHWRSNQNTITLAQIEGFVRQIAGWREFMRGIYWAKMPGFALGNHLRHQAELPEWYWTGDTKMNCLKHVIGQSLEQAWAHHIQRLMVAGNFALLAGVHPDAVDAWYLGVYIDAIEWVEITNTRGMSQYADGGLVGTKPYVSSANYIKKMSNYCDSCYYSHTQKTGDKACPFNSLYWHFYNRHRERLSNNPRIGMMYRVLDKMKSTERDAVLEQADKYLDKINEL